MATLIFQSSDFYVNRDETFHQASSAIDLGHACKSSNAELKEEKRRRKMGERKCESV